MHELGATEARDHACLHSGALQSGALQMAGGRTFGPRPSPHRWYTKVSLAIRIPFRWRYP